MKNQKLDITEVEETRNLHERYVIQKYHKLRFMPGKNCFDFFQMQIRCKIHNEQAYIKTYISSENLQL